jgi:uncharacterized membrane protein
MIENFKLKVSRGFFLMRDRLYATVSVIVSIILMLSFVARR